jgi:hypothetical protein
MLSPRMKWSTTPTILASSSHRLVSTTAFFKFVMFSKSLFVCVLSDNFAASKTNCLPSISWLSSLWRSCSLCSTDARTSSARSFMIPSYSDQIEFLWLALTVVPIISLTALTVALLLLLTGSDLFYAGCQTFEFRHDFPSCGFQSDNAQFNNWIQSKISIISHFVTSAMCLWADTGFELIIGFIGFFWVAITKSHR